eukprot:7385671-Prymnesium_polylepis.1
MSTCGWRAWGEERSLTLEHRAMRQGRKGWVSSNRAHRHQVMTSRSVPFWTAVSLQAEARESSTVTTTRSRLGYLVVASRLQRVLDQLVVLVLRVGLPLVVPLVRVCDRVEFGEK